MNVTEHIREHILLVLYDKHYRSLIRKKNITKSDMIIQSSFPFTIKLAKKWQWVEEFEKATSFPEIDQTEFFQRCLERMWQGKFRYCLIEHIKQSKKNKLILLNLIYEKYNIYHISGNLEYLCDSFNLTMILYYMNKIFKYCKFYPYQLFKIKLILNEEKNITKLTKADIWKTLFKHNIDLLKKSNCVESKSHILTWTGCFLCLEYNFPFHSDPHFKSIKDSERKNITLEI